MSLPIVFRQRFRIFIGRVTSTPPRPFPGATSLFEATKFDDTNIDLILRRALNRDDAIGFGDVLKKSIGPGELKGGTTIDDALAAIAKQARVNTIDAYRALVGPRVNDQLAIALTLAQFPPREPAKVQPTDPIVNYVTPANIDYIAKECNLRLDKWLLSLVTVDDFSLTLSVADVANTLLARTVVL